MSESIRDGDKHEDREVLRVRRFKAGYEVRDELVKGDEYGCADFEMKVAYTPTGDYIGDSKRAHRLCRKWGIAPEKIAPSRNVCSIGFSEDSQKWYGWSHRAMCGFAVGSVVAEGDCCASSGLIEEYLKEHPEEDTSRPVGFEAKSLDDAKKMAVAFAKSVG